MFDFQNNLQRIVNFLDCVHSYVCLFKFSLSLLVLFAFVTTICETLMNIQIRALSNVMYQNSNRFERWHIRTRKIIHFTSVKKKKFQPIHCSMAFLAENRIFNVHMVLELYYVQMVEHINTFCVIIAKNPINQMPSISLLVVVGWAIVITKFLFFFIQTVYMIKYQLSKLQYPFWILYLFRINNSEFEVVLIGKRSQCNKITHWIQ